MKATTLKYIIPAAVAICLACSLHSTTDDQRKAVVKLRDAMKELVDGSRTEITWYSSEKERYILFAGYMTEKDLTHPEISPELRKTLEDVAPRTKDMRLRLSIVGD